MRKRDHGVPFDLGVARHLHSYSFGKNLVKWPYLTAKKVKKCSFWLSRLIPSKKRLDFNRQVAACNILSMKEGSRVRET